MTVRCEIAEPRRETGARSPGDWLRRLRRCLSRSSDGDSNCLDCQGLNSSSMAHSRKNIAHNWSRIPDLCRIQALRCPSESRLRHLPPGGTVFAHRIQDDEQLAHARRERHLLGFPGGTQALIERTNDGIEAGGHECGHVEHGADLRTAAPDRAFPPPRPTVPIQRRPPPPGR